ncbi:MAG: hypothetical protein MUE30_01130 [Spirosomaceae bacterium]|nr:hypothetical protein [Spirosomataceae bacterium]
MATLTVFYVKLLLLALSSVMVWIGAQADTFWSKLQNRDTQVIGLAWAIFRLLPFILIFVLMNQSPRGDVPFFWGKASVAVTGKWVYKDFVSYHAPLFSYLIALPLLLWYSSKAIVLLMVLIEGVIVWLTYRVYQNQTANALKTTSLYLALSAPMVMVLLGGQEDIWIWGVAAWMLLYYQKNHKDGLGLGVRFASGLVLIKATFGFWLFPLWFLLKQRWPFLLGMLIVGIPTLVILYLTVEMAFLMPLQITNNLLTPNLFTVVRPLITALLGHAPDLPTFTFAGLVVTLSWATWIGYKLRHWPLERSLPLAFLATYVGMTIFQLTSPGYYAFTYLLPLVFELVNWKNKKDIVILLMFNALLVIQPFLFTYLNSPTYDDISVLGSPLYLLEYSLQWLNVLCFGWYFWKILCLSSSPKPSSR